VSFKSVDELLDFAISKEEKAYEFYMGLSTRFSRNPTLEKVFTGFAKEELGHKSKLQNIKQGQQLLSAADKVMDLKIADYTVDMEPNPEMDYGDALVLAMKMEKASFRLYSDLAASTNDATLAETLRALAQEEAKHKLRFELEYDEYAQREN